MFELFTMKVMQSPAECDRERVPLEGKHAYDEGLCVKLLKLKVVSGGFGRTLSENDRLHKRIKTFQSGGCVLRDK